MLCERVTRGGEENQSAAFPSRQDVDICLAQNSLCPPPEVIKHVLCKDTVGRCFLFFSVQCPFVAATHNGVQPDSSNVGANSIISLVLVELIPDL